MESRDWQHAQIFFASSQAASCNVDDFHVSDDDKGLTYFNIDMVLSLLSALSLAFVALLIFTDKRI